MLTMDLKNATVKEILSHIEEESEFFFLYNSKLIDVNRRANLTITNEKIDEVLAKLFENSGVNYVIYDRQIILSPLKYNGVNSASLQTLPVSGIVTNQNGDPLPGVTVVVKGTLQGAITDVQGRYTLTNVPADGVLVFSFVGMETQETAVEGRSVINITLIEELIGLEEVVAIGYGTARKADLTSAVTTVSTSGFDRMPAATPLHLLQGRSTGVQITTNSGMPGSGADVLIRGIQSIYGTNAPVYVVDGVIRTSIDNLNPNSIESISVLKDASAAAIYGARAANGVILVNTKRGTLNKDMQLTLNANVGIQTESNLKLKLLNAKEWLTLINESYQNANIDIPWTTQDLAYYQGVDTDWMDLVTQTGVIQNYDLSLSGGSAKSSYYISGSFMDHKGMVIETKFNKYTLNINTDHIINEWIKVGNSLVAFSEKRLGTGNESAGVYNMALRKVPLTRAYESDGDYGIIYNTTLEHMHANPIWMAHNDLNQINSEGLFGNLYVSIEPLKNLVFTARGNLDYGNNYSTIFTASADPHYGWERSTSNMVEKSYNKTIHWSSDFLLDYNTTLSDFHTIKILLGYSLEESSTEGLTGSRSKTPNNEIRYLTAGDPTSQLNTNSFLDWAFTSLFGRLNYSFKNKYLLTATIRRDGTSRLSKDERYGVFPSISAAWRISEEGFMDNVSFIDDLKFRISYGTLGNILSVGTYPTFTSLTSVSSVVNNAPAPAYTLTSAVNANLKWESALKRDLGIDITLLNNRLYSTIDFFIEDTYDLLFRDPIPFSTGLSGSPWINAGKVRNSGFELELGYRGRQSDWTYDVSFNLSHVKNRVVDLGGRDLRTSGLEEGYPVYSYFGYKANGIILNSNQLNIYQEGSFTKKEIGDVYLLDIDGYDAEGKLTGKPDGKVDAADRTMIGSKYPDATYGLLGTVGYKNWSLQLQLQGVHGQDLQILNELSYYSILRYMSGIARNEDARILNRYHPVNNPGGTWPRLDMKATGQNSTFSEFWLERASYLRVKNLNLNYNLPKDIVKRIRTNDLSLYLSIQNLWTFTGYGGPEVDTKQDPMTGVFQPRTWTLGLRAIF